jgi:hypothetical protein
MTISWLECVFLPYLHDFIATFAKRHSVVYKNKKKIFCVFTMDCFAGYLILFGSLPALDAQIHLMLGRYMGFGYREGSK